MEDDTDRSGRRRNPKNETTAGQGHADLLWRHSSSKSDESGLDR